ncbi:MAG: type II toxin-antitoxin system death-on-curing family toxin [Patescibacteria group bacterium]|nr:type II toxin-antitoxin system death-on-curing family toxin [Patescibacteria group bacterium]MDE1966108.1 type II toxin-antitoxin system death-on-curing family toxin [Patescibacteria group bacterium]
MHIKRPTLTDIEYVAHRLAKETLGWSEPIPDFSTRYTHALERTLEQPFQTYGGRQLYPTLLRKASILFYLMIKNHPFQNGNKRIAMTTLLYFLFINKKWVRVDNQELYNFAKWVAESNPKLKDATMSAIETFLKSYLEDVSSG